MWTSGPLRASICCSSCPPPPPPWGGYLDKPTLKSAVPLAVAAALAGAWIATNLDVAVLRKPFGVYLLLSGVSLLWPQRRKKQT